MAIVEYQPADSNADVVVYTGGAISKNNTNFAAGYSTAAYKGYGSAVRFTGVLIPQGAPGYGSGAIVTTAYLILHPRVISYVTGVVRSYLHFEDEDSSTDMAPVEFDAAALRALMWGAGVSWEINDQWDVDVHEQSPELKDILQPVINRAGWEPGNALTVLWEDWDEASDATDASYRRGRSYDSSPGNSPILHVEYYVLVVVAAASGVASMPEVTISTAIPAPIVAAASDGIALVSNVIVESPSTLAVAATSGIASVAEAAVAAPATFEIAATSGVASVADVPLTAAAILAAAATSGVASIAEVLVGSLSILTSAAMSGVASLAGVVLIAAAILGVASTSGEASAANVAVAAPATVVVAPTAGVASVPNTIVGSLSILGVAATSGVASVANVFLTAAAVLGVAPASGVAVVPNVAVSAPATFAVAPSSGVAAVANVTISTGTASTIATSTYSRATRTPLQRKGFYANGRFWQFYFDNGYMAYVTSTDGITWSSVTQVRTTGIAADFSLVFDGTYFHYACLTVGQDLVYRRGLPNADGVATWPDSAESTIASSIDFDPAIAVDSNGYPWIIASNEAWKSSTKNGTWTTERHDTMGSVSAVGEIVALSAGQMYWLRVPTVGGVKMTGYLWSGSAWGSAEAVNTTQQYWGYPAPASCVAIGDDVHVAFMAVSTYAIKYQKRTYGVGWGSEEEVLASGVVADSPALSHDPITGDAYCFWASAPTVDHVYYRKRTTAAWGSVVDWVDDSAQILYTNSTITCFPKALDSKIGVAWTADSVSPYNVRFAYVAIPALPILTVAPSSGVATVSNVTVATPPAPLAVAATSGAASVSNVTVCSLSILAAAPMSGVASVSNVTVSAVFSPLTVAAASGTASMSNVVVTAPAMLAIDAMSGVASLPNVTVAAATVGSLDVAAMNGAASVADVGLTAPAILSLASISGVASIGNVTVYSLSILDVAAASGVASFSNITLETGVTPLVVAAASGAASLSNVTVSSPSILTIAPTSGAASVTNVDILTGVTILVGPANGNSSVANVTVCSLTILAIDSASGVATMPNMTISVVQVATLTIAAMNGVASVGNVTIGLPAPIIDLSGSFVFTSDLRASYEHTINLEGSYE